MKGIVFNLLEEVVSREHGEDTWDDLLEAVHLDGAYTSIGNYDDSHLVRLVSAASATLNLPPDTVIRWFGRHALPILGERYPAFFTGHTSSRSFLLTLNEIIHPEVRKLYPGADVPQFEFDLGADECSLHMGYQSPRRLCALAEGFIEGAGDYFKEQVEVSQSTCMHRGDPRCMIDITFGRGSA